MTTVYLALGSNLGDSQNYIRRAVAALGQLLHNVTVSPLYSSKPVGYTDQPDFINTAVSGQTDLSAVELLTRSRLIEHTLGRMERFKNGPREIDIDLIFYGSVVLDSPELVLPHPLFRERAFVLQPLCDLSALLIDPVSGRTIASLLADLPQDASLIKLPTP